MFSKMMTADANAKRLLALIIFVAVAWGLLVYRVISIQVVHGEEYSAIARRQSTGSMPIPAERGTIYDRFGTELTVNVLVYSLAAQPGNKDQIDKIYKYLDRLFKKAPGYSRREYHLAVDSFKWIERRLPDDLAWRVNADSVKGLLILKDYNREYPFNEIGKQLVGSTNIDNKGRDGLENSQDSLLAGKPGKIEYFRDGQRQTYRLSELPQVQPVNGKSIVLTIDWNLQEIVESELKHTVDSFQAQEGSAVFMDCQTGEILAIADYVAGGKNDATKLRAVANVFEPGSVFKVFTITRVLEENKVDLNAKIYCENGVWKIGRRLLHDDKKHGYLTPEEIIELSSNIGTAKMVLTIGGLRTVEMIRRFNFAQKYDIGLPGEASGSIGDPGKYSDFNVAALAMGHSVSVTALQLAAGVSAIANGGKLYHPRIIKAILDENGKPIKTYDKELIGTVMKSSTAATLHTFMRGVVDHGTATAVKSDIISISGKTGTAEVANVGSRGYKKNQFVGSFIGFFPSENPRIAGVVVVHQPQKMHYGGYTAGPAFKNIAEKYIAANPGLRPDPPILRPLDSVKLDEIPQFVGLDMAAAMKRAQRDGIKLAGNSNEGTIVWQYPPAGRKIRGISKIAVVVEEGSTDSTIVPDLTGINLRTAIAMLDYLKIEFEVEGNGVVQRQEPKAGTPLKENMTCRMQCGTEFVDADSTKKHN